MPPKRKVNTLDCFVIKSKIVKPTITITETEPAAPFESENDCQEKSFGQSDGEKNRNNLEFTLPSNDDAATSSSQILVGPDLNTCQVDISDISNLLPYAQAQIDDNVKYNVITKDYKEGFVSYKFPLSEEGSHKRSFQYSWLTKYEWLTYSKINEGAFCKYCMLFGKATSHNAEVGYLVSRPLKKMKKALEAFKKHNYSQYHVSSLLDAESFKKVYKKKICTVQELCDSAFHKKVSENRKKLVSIVKTIIFHGRENIPLRGHREVSCSNILSQESTEFQGTFNALLKFRVDAGDQVLKEHLEKGQQNSLYVSSAIQNEIIEICGGVITKQIIVGVKNSPFFSVLCDETTDISGSEQMSICVRYLKDEKVVEAFITFVEVTSLTGENLANTILLSLEKYRLNIDFLRGQGYDGASNMSGKLNGVQAKIKERQPCALYTHCCSHVLNLAIVSATHGTSASRQIKNMLGTIKSTTNFLRDSHVRREILKKNLLEAQCNETQKTVLKQMCETRWIERHTVLIDFLKFVHVIVKSLEEINELGTQHSLAYSLLQAILSFEFLVSLVVCSEVSGLMLPVTKYLQTRNIDLFQAKKSVSTLQSILKRKRDEVDQSFDLLFLKIIDISQGFEVQPKAPRTCGKQVSRANVIQGEEQNVKQYYKLNLYIPFLDHCILELNERFGNQFLSICQLQIFLLSFITFASSEDVKKAVESVSYPDISNFDLQFESEIWKQTWEEKNGENIPSTALASLPVCCSVQFPNIRKILEVLCVLPVTSAEPERTFSVLRRLKTWLRATTSEARLNGLASMNIHKEIKIDPEEVVEQFANKKKKANGFDFHKKTIV